MEKKETYLALLNDQLNKLEEKSFDLSSWKRGTKLIMEIVFGLNAPQVKAIEKIDYAYSSWALRDESGATDPVKTACRSTLEVIIREVELMDTYPTETEKSPLTDKELNFIWDSFENELTGASVKKLKQLLLATEIQPLEVEKFLKDLPGQTTVTLLQAIISAPQFTKWLTNQ